MIRNRDGPASEREGKRVSGTASPPEDSVHAKMDDDLLTKASSMGGFHVTQLHGAAAQVSRDMGPAAFNCCWLFA